MDEKQLFGDSVATQLWDTVLRTQVDLTFNQELPLYYRSAAWVRACTVLDVGCGNGYYVSRLKDVFGQKHYSGLDSSPPLIRLASLRHSAGNLNFICGELFDFAGEYDFVVARAILQYVSDSGAFLRAMDRLLARNGVVIIIEREDKKPYFFYPEAPRLVFLMELLQAEQSRHRVGLANLFDNLLDSLKGVPALKHVGEEIITVPSTLNNNKELHKELFRSIIRMAEASGFAKTDFKGVTEEWNAWCEIRDSYADLRLRVVTIVKELSSPG